MRHLYGIGFAVLLAAAVFFGAAWGYQLVFDGTQASGAAGGLPAGGGSLFSNHHVMAGGGLMLAVGLAIGLLMLIPWVSPLAAGLPGLVLVAWTALYVSDVREAVKLIPLASHGFGIGFQLLLYNGLLGMIGLAMTIPLFIPSRWRRPPRAAGYTPLVESVPAKDDVAVSLGTGAPDLSGTFGGFTTPPPPGDGNVIFDRTQTLPHRGPLIRPEGSQDPEASPDQG